jgi:hypothetical protein
MKTFQDERTYQLIVQNCPPHIDTETVLEVASVLLKFRDKESALFGRWLKIATRQLTDAVHTMACTGMKKRP